MTEHHSSTRGKLEQLLELRAEALHAGSDRAVQQRREKGSLLARERAQRLCDPELVRRARPLRAPPGVELRDDGPPPLRRCGRHRLRDDLRAARLRVLAGLHGFRRLAERGLRREDLQGDGHGGEVPLPADRDQRLGRRPDPGGGRLARGLCGDLLAERPGLGSGTPALARARALRRRGRVLPRDDRLRPDVGGVVHVHHRPRRREDGDRRGGDLRGARRRLRPRLEVGCRPLHRRR